MDLTLEQWRISEGLTYEQLAERLCVATATQARRYALGLAEAPAALKERARAASGGKVTPEGFHRARLEAAKPEDATLAPEPEPVG
ncbi:hypothetical protein [Chenggangzhangella methanolivorans]|uniref:Uncharacterized protein n=1 Tax=Chenggangzhangella methanolivorans TaxID=1437009 RepID=A0A9E6R787_9HYPH|nr:hypothetical protein [Chenggangzhangella methanolivorans]QZN99515.1 hypothetical protein K6K41_22845 [Chenggangzhangella methanolivorans]